MYYYQRLKDLREDHDKTQAEIASFLGMKFQQYSRYEIGVREIPLHHLISLARYYNVSLDYLTGLVDTYRTLDGSPSPFEKKYNLNQKGNITNNFN